MGKTLLEDGQRKLALVAALCVYVATRDLITPCHTLHTA